MEFDQIEAQVQTNENDDGSFCCNDLKVMDITAITLAKENKIPIVVFSILQKDSLIEIIDGVGSFTTIKG